jgi:hypothetical protein
MPCHKVERIASKVLVLWGSIDKKSRWENRKHLVLWTSLGYNLRASFQTIKTLARAAQWASTIHTFRQERLTTMVRRYIGYTPPKIANLTTDQVSWRTVPRACSPRRNSKRSTANSSPSETSPLSLTTSSTSSIAISPARLISRGSSALWVSRVGER